MAVPNVLAVDLDMTALLDQRLEICSSVKEAAALFLQKSAV